MKSMLFAMSATLRSWVIQLFFFFFLATAAFISQWNSINPEALLHEEMFFLAISTVKNQYYEHGCNKLSDITR